MNRSKTIALILGPCLVIAALAVYWVTTRLPAADAPLELHGNVAPKPQAAAAPPPAHLTGTEPEAAAPTGVPAPLAAIETPASPQTAPSPAPAPVARPKFDVVRVEPSGDAVIAGHTEPNSQVAVIANGKVIAEGKSDAAGQFAFVPPPLAPGEHGLSLRVTPPSGSPVVSDQNVAVSVPVKGKGEVMVALAEPGKATVLLADPTAKAELPQPTPKAAPPSPAKPGDEAKQAAPPVKPEVAIKTAEIVEPGGFFATGIAAPGAHLRLYLNGSALAEVVAGPDGRWSVKVGKGLVPGHYAVRADQIDHSGSVVARAEVPFDYTSSPSPKEAVAAVAPPPTPAIPAKEPDMQAPRLASQEHDTPAATRSDAEHAPSTAPSADGFVASTGQSAAAVVPEIQTATVERGYSLWRISRKTLGRGTRYTEIYAANSSQIRDPKLIYPGQVFVIPGQTN
ncbi:LysM peptidoglycan-binding domain-containing protein [Methyloferula stellata]|uniref:LysM peptidoglycan-binding domain-containing protein n=1 Tax=Methyloferula stellata TaxID=876270 RepID=UPI000369C511|nr:LysM peptidoglycan-binding domain-containing protein [Methyloferula stellata]